MKMQVILAFTAMSLIGAPLHADLAPGRFAPAPVFHLTINPKGSCDHQQLKQKIEKMRKRLFNCFQFYGGETVIELKFAPDGKVAELRRKAGDLPQPMQRCVEKALREVVAPHLGDGPQCRADVLASITRNRHL